MTTVRNAARHERTCQRVLSSRLIRGRVRYVRPISTNPTRRNMARVPVKTADGDGVPASPGSVERGTTRVQLATSSSR